MRTQLRTRGIPFVVVDPTGEPVHDTPSVGATNWNGGLPRPATSSASATAGSRSSAGRRGSCAAGPASTATARRWTRPACRSTRTLISHGEFHVEEGVRKGRALLALPDRPTAIFAGNDLQALGVYQAAREARLHIPEDLSVVGFDDLPVARWVGPPLTTIRQPLIEMAVAAAELVLAIARGEQPVQTRVELATELGRSARARRRRAA